MSAQFRKTIILASILVLSTSCATLDTNKKKTLASIAGGIVGGAILGAAATPQGDPQGAWMLLGASSGAALGATTGFLLFDEEKVSDQLRQEKASLQKELDILKAHNEPQLTGQGSSLMNAPLPADAKGLVQPGGWKRYKLDRWVQDSENKNTWYRQTEMFEFNLPSVGGE